MSKTETLSIDLLRLDAGTQARVKTSEETVVEYAELLTEKTGWPFNNPVDVFHDGTDYFVADGFHRVLAANRVKRASVPCRIHSGTAHDAKIFGMTANDHHGLRMSRADKRACVQWLLDNGGKLTQEELSKKAGVSRSTLNRIISEKNQIVSMTQSDQKTLGKSSEVTPETVSDGDDPPFDDVPAMTPAEKKAAAKAAAKEAKKAEQVAAKAAAAKAKEEAKAAAKAAREKAKADEKAAKLAKLPIDEQAKFLRNQIQQHLDRAVRLIDDLHQVKSNHSARIVAVKALQGVRLW